MATLLLSAVGTAIGGPLGGALGALLGNQVDSAIIGRRRVEGPRLKELTVQTSSYGSPLPRHFGRVRAAGTVIWSTELVEHSERQGGGKGRPSVTTYSYTVSFAVALSSRPINGVGRIWADGNLLRGSAGDLKAAGEFRLHSGHGDQDADPLLVQAIGPDDCTAFRGTAYVVFESLDLANFGNRIPSLSFEIFADGQGSTVDAVIGDLVPQAAIDGLSDAVDGFSVDGGTIADVLETLSAAYPVFCSAWGEALAFHGERIAAEGPAPSLPESAAARAEGGSARQTGIASQRAALPRQRSCGVRYYDVERDYQPGLQRGRARAGSGELSILELPMSLTPHAAASVADAAGRRRGEPAESIRYRVAAIDARFGPGATVTIPATRGKWRVDQWEWLADGVELRLSRISPPLPEAGPAGDAGAGNLAPDLASSPTRLAAFELPWDGVGNSEQPLVMAAAGSESAGWRGAALYLQQPDGGLQPIGSASRRRAVLGSAVGTLPAASPLLLDRKSTVDVQLAGADFTLSGTDFAGLAGGANRALLGSELIQFGLAEQVGTGVWRLSHLLRGRGGTEHAVIGHVPGESFVLLDDRPTPLDPAFFAGGTAAPVVAVGTGDATPVASTIVNGGIGWRPLSPVHLHVLPRNGSVLPVRWKRRARGAWLWVDEVEVPLNEQRELWSVELWNADQRLALWQTAEPQLSIDVALVAGSATPCHLEIRQVGNAGQSLPLFCQLPSTF